MTSTISTAGDVTQCHAALSNYLRQQSSASTLTIEVLERLSGGAIQENWLVVAELKDGPWQGRQRWVLRTDALSSVPVSLSRAEEFAVLRVAHQAGVKVPEVLWCCADRAILGRDFFVMQCVPGVAAGHTVSRDASSAADPLALVEELGATLARLHAITPPHAALAFLPAPASNPAQASIASYRSYLDELGVAAPVLEWGLNWCQQNSPAALPARLLHRDFRTGNYMVHEGHLSGLLDWEFTGWGDPREDIGWFTARCWRFGAPHKEAGGIGHIDDFLRAYTAVSGLALSRKDLIFWQVMAHVRWAVIALQQAERHLSGQQKSLELALTGRMLPELELEILALTRGEDNETA